MSEIIDGILNLTAFILIFFGTIPMIYSYIKKRQLFHIIIWFFTCTVMLYVVGNALSMFNLWAYGEQFGETFAIYACSLGTIAALASIIEHKIENLRLKAEKSNKASDNVIEAAAEVSVNTSNIATDLAASANEVNATAEDIASTTMEVTIKAKNQADSLIKIDQRTQDISNIVKILKEISDKTNLLALNASIEAGRAGENGRGFAVVAERVQKLAEESSNSVEETTEIIASIVKDIQNAAAESKGVSKAMEDINTAVEEQTASMEEITGTINRLGKMAENLKDDLMKNTRNR